MNGAAPVESENDLLTRSSLLFPSLGLAAELLRFTDNVHESFTAEERAKWLSSANSANALTCICRFAAVEGDLAKSSWSGFGRVSPKGFPRLGEVLRKEAVRADTTSAAIVGAVEQTIQAGYLATVGFTSVGDRRIAVEDVDRLWGLWLPNAYSVPNDLASLVLDVVAVVEYWQRSLTNLGLHKAAKSLCKPGSDVNRSIGGLGTVGAALAVAERFAG